MGRIFDEKGKKKEEYQAIPQSSAVPQPVQQTQPQLSPYQKFVSGGAIPTIGALLGFGGGMLAGGPAGAALGTASVGGGAKVMQEMLKLKAGLPQTPSPLVTEEEIAPEAHGLRKILLNLGFKPSTQVQHKEAEQFVKEEPVKFAERYVAGGAGGQLLKSLPMLLGSLPIIGPKLQQMKLEKSGKEIEKLTKLSEGNYPKETLINQIDEKTAKFMDTPKLAKVVNQEKDIIRSKVSELPDLIDQRDLQFRKEILDTRAAWSKGEKLTATEKEERQLYRTLSEIYTGVTEEVAGPALKEARTVYGGAKNILEGRDKLANLLKRRAWWTGSGIVFYEIMRRLRQLGKEKETRGR